MVKVYDSLGNFMKEFPNSTQAINYKTIYGNSGWSIKYPDNKQS